MSGLTAPRRVLSLALAAAGLALGAVGISGLTAHRAAAAPPRLVPGVTATGRSTTQVHHVSTGDGVGGAQSRDSGSPTHVPVKVVIPALSASAPVVEHVGVQASGPERGLLSAPANFHDLGWYRYDNKGVLVIDGHVGFAAGAGPLAYIGSLKLGDAVLVTYGHGTEAYRVSEIHSVLKGDLPHRYFTGRYDGRIMLITCDYQSAFHDGHFANNVYVIASPENSR